MSANIDLYDEYVAGADKNDRARFDAHLLGWLINATDVAALRVALEESAKFVNGSPS